MESWKHQVRQMPRNTESLRLRRMYNERLSKIKANEASIEETVEFFMGLDPALRAGAENTTKELVKDLNDVVTNIATLSEKLLTVSKYFDKSPSKADKKHFRKDLKKASKEVKVLAESLVEASRNETVKALFTNPKETIGLIQKVKQFWKESVASEEKPASTGWGMEATMDYFTSFKSWKYLTFLRKLWGWASKHVSFSKRMVVALAVALMCGVGGIFTGGIVTYVCSAYLFVGKWALGAKALVWIGRKGNKILDRRLYGAYSLPLQIFQTAFSNYELDDSKSNVFLQQIHGHRTLSKLTYLFRRFILSEFAKTKGDRKNLVEKAFVSKFTKSANKYFNYLKKQYEQGERNRNLLDGYFLDASLYDYTNQALFYEENDKEILTIREEKIQQIKSALQKGILSEKEAKDTIAKLNSEKHKLSRAKNEEERLEIIKNRMANNAQ
jgi:hypothetical protein